MNWDIAVPNSPDQASRWSSDWSELFLGVIGLIIVMGVIMWVYRSMQHPRLYLATHPTTGEPTVRWQAVVRYVVLTPIVLFLWLWAILLILTIAAEDRSAQELVLAAAVVVGAARVLAHISPEASHELGKTIPLAVLTIILLGGGTGERVWADLITDIDANADVLNGYYVSLIVLDVLITAWWFWRRRENWRSQLPGSARRRFTAWFAPVSLRWRAFRDFGKPKMAATGSYREGDVDD